MRRDVTRARLVRAALRSRWPQLLVTALALGGFIFAIVAGFAGTPVGSRNFGIVFVWIVWWAALMLIAVPLAGRAWCSICPIPAPGEWLQRGAVLSPTGRGLGGRRRWPTALRNIWLQNAAFVAIALFSVVILTTAHVTALVLAAVIVLATLTSLVFERRAFCRFLCPVGGFIGLYAQLAPLAVRVKDAAVCAAHTEKTCYAGNGEGYGCPWQVFPGALRKNTYCGTCVECLRTCPHDNVAVYLRPIGEDLFERSGRRLDEAFKAFIMLGSAVGYTAVMLGPWGALKAAAQSVGSVAWAVYALVFVALVLGVLPGLFLGAVVIGRRLARSTVTVRRSFVTFAYALVPLGLAAWIAFSLGFVFTNLSYVWPVVSDPMGWGWDLFGTARAQWSPYLGRTVPVLQTVVLVLGLFWASVTAHRMAAELVAGDGRPLATALHASPVVALCVALTVTLLGLLV